MNPKHNFKNHLTTSYLRTARDITNSFLDCPSEFLQNFVLAGGIHYLSEVLQHMILDIENTFNDSVLKSCMAMLLKIVGFFFVATVDPHLTAR